jgi:AraC-like DNA-binding protein
MGSTTSRAPGAAPGAPDAGPEQFARGTAGPPGAVVSAVGYRSEHRQPTLHRGLPSPYLTLIFSLDGPVTGGSTPQQARGPGAQREDIVLGGLGGRPVHILQPERQTGIQLAVHPLAARALLGVPASALTGDAPFLAGADVLGREAEQVRERLCGQTRWDERFATVARYVERRLAAADARPVRPEVAEAWAWLARRHGAGTLEGLAAHVALGPRRLTTVFRAETGLTPKQVARLMRFQRAKSQLVRETSARGRADVSRAAAACGYFDHSHLVRDFRQYTGLSPTAWLAEECRNIQAGGHRYGEEWEA